MTYLDKLFSLNGTVAVITGGAGVLGQVMARGLGKAGANIVLTDVAPLDQAVATLAGEGVEARGLFMDVLSRESLQKGLQEVMKMDNRVDVLLNAAGGNRREATVSPEISFFDLPLEPLEQVVSLNLFGGAVLPSQVFGKAMAENPNGGCIINVSSMTAFRPLTRVVGYSAAKAAVSNFTQWLAVTLARDYTPKLRVNALAPGFFATEQNRFLLYEQDEKTLTPRGRSIIDHTPAGRFGAPDDLISTVLWLVSPASSFVTGTVIPIDGGFSAFSGV